MKTLRRVCGGVLIAAAGVFGPLWIARRRRRYRRMGRGLSSSEVEALQGWFEPALLARVRIAEVQCISPPLSSLGAGWLLRVLQLRGMLDVRSASGMAFGDAIVIAAPGEPVSASLLFHELVHTVQYRQLGLSRFCRAYVRGWLEAGRSYFDIPLEAQAFALQSRFDAGERFDVEAIVFAGQVDR